jgi:pimeloyl-[acyl-carrier protein] methyl ester esterase
MSTASQLHYRITGQGKHLLLVHGWAMHGGVFAELAENLSGTHQIITIDLRGHGSSRAASGANTFEDCARDIIDLLSSRSPEPVAALGWSMGASILLKAVEMAPGLFDSLIFMSANPSLVSRPDYPCGIPEITVRRLYRQIERSYPDGLKNFYSLLLTPPERELFGNDMRYGAMTDLSLAPDRDTALSLLACLMQEDLRPALARICAPTLLLHGGEDGICNPAGAAFMHSHIPGSKFVLLPNTGHAPFLTRSSEVFGHLRLFLKSQP